MLVSCYSCMRKQLKFVSICEKSYEISHTFTFQIFLFIFFLNLFRSEIGLYSYLFHFFSSILHINLKVLWNILVDFVIIRWTRWPSIRWSSYLWSYNRFEKDLSYLKVFRKTYNKHPYNYDCNNKTQQTERTK